MAESKAELKGFFFFKGFLMKVKEESKKAGLKLNIQKMKIMASSPITSRQIDGETMEATRDFIFLGSKITADGECSLEIKRRLLLGQKAMTNLDSILKSRDITLPVTKVHLVVWRLLKKLGIKPPYDPAIPLLGIYPEEVRTEKTLASPCSLQLYLQHLEHGHSLDAH